MRRLFDEIWARYVSYRIDAIANPTDHTPAQCQEMFRDKCCCDLCKHEECCKVVMVAVKEIWK